MTAKQKRVHQTISLIKDSGSLSIRNLSEILAVSIMTVRRDIDDILLDPEIQLIRGMFLYTHALDKEEGTQYSVISASTENKESKQRIAEEAIKFIDPEDRILIDAGSTTEYLANRLPENRKIDVVCFSLNILNIILTKEDTTITLPGGKYHASSMMFESREAVDLVRNNRVNKAFLSASGINLRLGATCSAEFERDLKRSALKSALTRILLIDSSKFTKIESLYFADIRDFDIIITDSGVEDKTAEAIRSTGINLRIV